MSWGLKDEGWLSDGKPWSLGGHGDEGRFSNSVSLGLWGVMGLEDISRLRDTIWSFYLFAYCLFGNSEKMQLLDWLRTMLTKKCLVNGCMYKFSPFCLN